MINHAGAVERAEAAGSHGVPPPPSARRLWTVRIATALIVVGATLATFYAAAQREQFQRYAGTPLGLVLLFGLQVLSSATLILPVPGLAFTALAGALVPPLVVGVICGIGQTLGELTGYMAGYSGQTLVQGNARYASMVRWMRQYGMATLFVLGVIPNPLFDVAGMIAGALRMPAWRFLLATGAGKIAKNIAVAYLGHMGIQTILRWLKLG